MLGEVVNVLRGTFAAATASVDFLSLRLNNSTLARATSANAPGTTGDAPTTADSLPSMMQFASRIAAHA